MKKAKLFMMLALLIMGVSNVFAQDVTISPQTGNLMAGYTSAQGETGYAAGFYSMWRHEQLALTMTTSDQGTLTETGESLQEPSCAITYYDFNGQNELSGKYMVIAGNYANTHLLIALPKGYRITGYEAVVTPNLLGKDLRKNTSRTVFQNMPQRNQTFGEVTKSHFAEATPSTYITMAQSASGNTTMATTNEANAVDYTIKRSSTEQNPMTNQLYFFVNHSGGQQYGFTIKKFIIYFTAEGTFEASVTPSHLSPARSLVTSPFQTSKVDIGKIEEHTRDRVTRYSYTYANTKELKGYNYLYQSDALAYETDDEGNNIESTAVPADVAENKHIYTTTIGGNNYFAFGEGTYFVEPPVKVFTPTGLSAPIGYRIVGADFECVSGSSSARNTTENGYYIQYRSGRYTYYLNHDLHFTTSQANAQWEVDDNFNLVCPAGYLACEGSGDTRTLSISTVSDSRFNLVAEGGYVYYLSDGGNFYYVQGRTNTTATVNVVKDLAQNSRASSQATTININIPAVSSGSYTLEIYGTDKVKPIKTLTGGTGSYSFEDLVLNNDAVMFKISNLETGKQAIVNITLKLQALDPYINSMNIKCQAKDENNNPLSTTQTFTASDFRVSGGQFVFYVPENWVGKEVQIEFADLYSDYGDKTYWGEEASLTNSRYSFVSSDYFLDKIDGNGNLGLYDPAYNPNAGYENKVLTSTAGNMRFKFNNAEDITDTSGGVFIETPFTVAAYLDSTDPDGKVQGKGKFEECKVTVLAEEDPQKFGTFYQFTADETRYNIAPTKGWQHRSYAFYRMDVQCVAKKFLPKLTWTELYQNTVYKDANNPSTDSQWGVTVQTTDKNGVDMKGFLTYNELKTALETEIADEDIETADDLDKILYIDCSGTLSVNEDGGTVTLATLKNAIGKNALIFLPNGTTSTSDNVAYMTQTGLFRAGNDFVLVDKYPFYSPYNIQVAEKNSISYKRQITLDKYGKVQNASLIVPFEVSLTNGTHKNPDGTTFSLHKMKDNNALSLIDGTTYAYYPQMDNVSVAAANTPYLVQLTTNSSEDNVSFVVEQPGSEVFATAGLSEDNTITVEETTTGTASAGEAKGKYKFTNKGTYAGAKVAKAEEVFYFAKNMFVSSGDLSGDYQYAIILPFRAFYASEYTGDPGAKLTNFRVIFGDKEDDNSTTGISELKDVDLAVIPGKGIITLMARAEKDVTIHAVSGITVDKCNLKAGEARTVAVPAGVYVINGVKMVVK